MSWYSNNYGGMDLLCVVEDLEYGLHALVSDGGPGHGVEDLIEWAKQSLNKHIPQRGVFPHRYKPGILLEVGGQMDTHTHINDMYLDC